MSKDVTPAVRELLDRLNFRRSLGTSYLTVAPGMRWALIVPTMMRGNPLERHTKAYTARTISTAKRLELIAVAEKPERLPYGYRKAGDGELLYAVSLTDVALWELERGRGLAFKDYALSKD